MMAIDSARYGWNAIFERDLLSFFTALAYKARSGFGLGVGFACQFLVPFIGATATIDSTGKLLCGTTVRAISFDVSVGLFHLSLRITMAHGKRDDELVSRVEDAVNASKSILNGDDWKPTSYQYKGDVEIRDDGAGTLSGKS